MPSGGARRGAGRPRKGLALHQIEGTIRPARHGNVLAMPRPDSGADWWPADADVQALWPRSQEWLEATLHLYRLSAVEGGMVLLAMRSLTRCEQLEAAIADVGVANAGGLLGALARESRIFLAAWAAAGIEKS